MHGHIADASTPDRDAYPPNHVADPLVAALGGPEQYIFGNLTICDSHISTHSGTANFCGLIEAQQWLITGVHAAMSKDPVTRTEHPPHLP
ncbi:hypothetical protein [Streptomyces sp. NPDC001070]